MVSWYEKEQKVNEMNGSKMQLQQILDGCHV